MRVLGIVFALALAATGSAHAEKVKANQETRVLNHPGEQGKLVVKVKEGQSMTLLSSEGRWLKVRVQGRTGWVPRSKVEMADPDEIARNTRRRPFVDGRSTHRGFGSQEAPDDRIGADAVGGGDEDKDKNNKDSDDEKPAAKKPKKPTKDDDADDEKPAAKKPAAKPTGKKPAKDDDDDEDEKPAAKKPVVKPTGKKPTKDDDDDEDEKPAAKKPVKAPEKPTAKKPTKDEDDDEDEKPAAKPAAKKPEAAKKPTKDDDDDESPKTKPTAKPKATAQTKAKSDDDDDDDGGKKKPAAKDDDDAAPAEPKRAKAHVSGKQKVFGERDVASDVEFTAKPTDILYPGETKGDWTKVESDDGDEGWILTDKLEVDGGSPGGSHKRTIGINVGLGFGYMSQAMNTVGTAKTAGTDQVPDVYNIGTSTATLSLGGSYFTGLGKYLVGVDAGYGYSKTVGGGITYMKTVTGVTLSDFTLRGAIAYPTSRPSGLTLVARLGFRYRGYLVADYATLAKNPAQIPQETVAAPTLGFGIALPKLTDKIGLQIGLDAILFGASVTQTVGLEDGATPSMSDINLNAGLVYAMNPTMNVVFAYDLDHGSYDFGKPNTGIAMMSKRIHTGTDVQRTDTLHSLTVSIAKGF
jgi:SH3-like domain-containing protein